MIRDRGNIKWTAMMLPEHVAMLRELKKKNNDKKKPVFDEQQLEIMNEKIAFSLERKCPIEMTYFDEYDYKTVQGIIHHVDVIEQQLKIVTEDDICFLLKLKNIIDIKGGD